MSKFKRLNDPRAAVIVSHNRSGGTYLCHCLNNHLLVHCFADEVLHQKNVFGQVIHDPVDILRIVLHLNQFEVSMCKISYAQFLAYPQVRDYLWKVDAKVIHLYRRNWLASAMSEMIRHRKYRPTHVFYEVPETKPAYLDVDRLHQIMWKQKGQSRKVRELLSLMKADVMPLSYPEIVGGEGVDSKGIPSGTAIKICNYLGVPHEPLRSGHMRKVTNPYLAVTNWDEIKVSMKGTKFEGCVREIEHVYKPD